jgi:ACS family sodium-dependent inorganic phosphate cotransporter
MLLASADRTIFSLAALAIASDLALSLPDLAHLQAAYLWGYGLTQALAGFASDAFGGARTLLLGLALWSLAVAAVPLAALAPDPLVALALARFLHGAASGCAVPATAAAVAAHVPSQRRGGALAAVYAWFNVGSAFGLACAGAAVAGAGWQAVFVAFGLAGVAWAAVGYAAILPEEAKAAKTKRRRDADGALEATRSTIRAGAAESKSESESATFAAAAFASTRKKMKKLKEKKPPLPLATLAPQLACLVYVHACINWGFFIMQSWLPTYLASELGLSLAASGAAAAAPWLLTALSAFHAGRLADEQIAAGVERWRVRRRVTTVATAGPVAALALLSRCADPAPALALVALALATQAAAVAGYHAYVQDCLPSRAGAFLGVTNTVGVLAGIAANAVTGRFVAGAGGFGAVFLLTAGVYASAGGVWWAALKGKKLFPEDEEEEDEEEEDEEEERGEGEREREREDEHESERSVEARERERLAALERFAGDRRRR